MAMGDVNLSDLLIDAVTTPERRSLARGFFRAGSVLMLRLLYSAPIDLSVHYENRFQYLARVLRGELLDAGLTDQDIESDPRYLLGCVDVFLNLFNESITRDAPNGASLLDRDLEG